MIAVCFLLLYVAFPYLCLGYMFKERRPFYAFFQSLITGSVVMIFIVYILYFMGIYSRVTFITALFLFAVLSQLAGGKARINEIKKVVQKQYILIKNGYFRWKTLFINLGARFRSDRQRPRHGYLLTGLLSLAIVACVAYGLYVRLYPTVTLSYFGVSDLYVHMDWLRDMQNGQLFANGVYPYGFHNMIIAFNKLFPFDLVMVLRLWGALSYMLILTGFVFLVFKMFKSLYARLAVIWVFCVSDIFVYFRYIDFRLTEALPQECALIFVLPAIILFIDYLSDGDNRNLILSALCFGLTVLVHFYATIFLCFAYAVVVLLNLRRVFAKKTFLSLVGVYGVVGLLSIAPFVIGIAKGIPFEKSIGWALGVTQTAPKDTVSNENVSDNFESEVTDGMTGIQRLVTLCTEEVRWHLLPDREVVKASMTIDINGSYMLRSGQNKYAIPLTASVAAAAVLIIWGFVKRLPETKLRLWLVMYCTLLFALAIAYLYGVPQIIVILRQRMLLRIMIVPIFGFVPELIDEITESLKHKAVKIPANAVLLALVFCLGYDSAYLGHLASKTVSMQAQYEQTVEVIDRIRHEFPRLSYTVISTTHEMSLIKNEGYHYELIRLLRTINDPNAQSKQYIPTENIFVFIEKTVLPVYQIVDYSHPETLVPGPTITREAGLSNMPDDRGIDPKSLSEFYYVKPHNRLIIMSKAYLWANEYRKYYPDEMSVYYEDDDLVVYRIKQDVYALNNLTIDYIRQ